MWDSSNERTKTRLQAEFLPKTALYGPTGVLGWEVSPQPYSLTTARLRQIESLGHALTRFMTACDHLYRESSQQRLFPWVAELVNQGKPEALIRFARMKRFKGQLPAVIRPDLLVTEDGFALCEIDAVPGGMGFTAALNQAYFKSGFGDVIGAGSAMVDSFLTLLLSAYTGAESEPVLAIAISDEAGDYRSELTWLCEAIRENYPNIFIVRPQDLELSRDKLVFIDELGEARSIDVIYRFFELFDLPNIHKMELIQYAIKQGWVDCTPPFAFPVEEKLWLALLHHPVLRPYWLEHLGVDYWEALLAVVPPGRILDPSPLPPQAVIPNLAPAGVPIQDFKALGGLTQKQRELVIKPSGFSPMAWGSRGVTVGHDVSQVLWQEHLDQALQSFGTTPYLLQTYRKPVVEDLSRLDLATGAVTPFNGRTRLCPYYFVEAGQPTLAGVLATSCPADKKIIHGMKDAILAPCLSDQTNRVNQLSDRQAQSAMLQ